MIGYNKNEIVGKMRERVILQNRVISQSDSGFQSETYSNIATLWTALDYKSGFEEEDADKIVTQQKINFTLRYNQNITTDSRFVYRDSLYQIEKIDISNDRRFVFCTGVYRSSYTGSYALTIDVAASVNGSATLSANVNSLLYLACQANASASTNATLTSGQQLIIEVASLVNASANVNGAATIVQYVASSVNAQGISIADALLTKTFTTNVNANATTSSILTVTTQGVTSVDASVTATGTTTANVLRIATLQSSSSTTADTSAIASLTKVLEASATATAQTSSNAQLTLAVNAAATTTAITSADAQLSYTVNASADATAQTSADAFITRIISASATATANSSAEAGIGVTFVAAAVASASVTNASVTRTATLAASVTGAATVTGATLDVNTPLLLDLYPNAVAAYSLRKLRTAYTGSAIRVRRSSDNTEQDIGFDSNNNLNESALTTFVGANNGFVVTWYDQSGNARNATQSTAANQPQIVSSGSVIKLSSKPVCQFDGTNDILTISNTLLSSQQFSIFTINSSNTTAAGGRNIISNWATTNTVTSIFLGIAGSTVRFTDELVSGNYGSTSTRKILTGISSSSNAITYLNNTVLATKGSAFSTRVITTNFIIGRQGAFDGEYWNGTINEIIVYSSDQTSNKDNIHNNVNAYYAIY